MDFKLFFLFGLLLTPSIKGMDNEQNGITPENLMTTSWGKITKAVGPGFEINSFKFANEHMTELRKNTSPEGVAIRKMWFRYYHSELYIKAEPKSTQEITKAVNTKLLAHRDDLKKKLFEKK